MDCFICDNSYAKPRKPICPSCAQAMLYEPRIKLAAALLDRENAHTRSEAIVRPGNDGVLAALPQDADWDAITNGVKKHNIGRSRAEQERAEARTKGIIEHSKILRKQIEEFGMYAAEQKRQNDKRRQDIKVERRELEKRIPQLLEPIEAVVRKASQRLDKVFNRTVDARAFICKHTSLLSGLSEVKRKNGKPSMRYKLDGLVLVNLKELHAKGDDFESLESSSSLQILQAEHHEYINACLDNICRLVRLWCHYLSIRLPAEIILPQNDFPHSTILSERSSYKVTELPYPGTLSNQANSPTASRTLQDQRNLPRPRLLHLDRPLARLMKEDSKTFGLFLEGTMLLAWDVAWLCRTQGITSINTFDDICDIGRNLWLLSRAQDLSSSGKPSLDRMNTTATDTASRTRKASNAMRFGSFSHGNLRHSLAGNEGAAILHDWPLAQPHRLVDKLRQYILTEITGEEWDVLSEGDYDDERQDEVAVLVGGTERRSFERQHPAMSVISVVPSENLDRRAKGESGWMKVRGRNGGA